MKLVPVMKCSDLERSVRFYTQVLDFERKWPGNEDRESANGVIDLVKDGAEIQLSRHAGDGAYGALVRLFVDDVDERYTTYKARGLHTRQQPESPVHTAPVDQTWGLREFAIGDPDGNGLLLCGPCKEMIGEGSSSAAPPPSIGRRLEAGFGGGLADRRGHAGGDLTIARD